MQTVPLFNASIIGETVEVDEAQRILCRELVDLRVKQVAEPTQFSLSMQGFHLGRLLLSTNHFGTDTVIDVGWVDDAVIVAIGDRQPTPFHIDGTVVRATPEQAVILSPTKHVVNERPANVRAYGLRAPASAIANRLYELTERHVGLQPIVFDHRVDLCQGPGAQFARMLRFVLSELQAGSSGPPNQVLYATFDDMLLGAMLLLPNTYSKVLEQTRHPTAAPPLVRRAEAYLEAHANEAMTMSHLVTVCGCNRASLFKSFRQYRGYTPMQFLTERRLQNARKHLLNAHPSETVTSIAYACGFSHLGRFSQAYRNCFGEYPSDTLRRASG